MFGHDGWRDRVKGAAAAIMVQATIGYALFVGLTASFSRLPDKALSVFRVTPPPTLPREQVVPPVVRSTRPAGEASPPNLRASPSERVAPPMVVPLPPLLPAGISRARGRRRAGG